MLNVGCLIGELLIKFGLNPWKNEVVFQIVILGFTQVSCKPKKVYDKETKKNNACTKNFNGRKEFILVLHKLL